MEVRDELRRASEIGRLGYKDASDMEFPVWDGYAGTFRRHPKFHDTINAYLETLLSIPDKVCFLYDYTFSEWEQAVRTNTGGEPPAIGFWELKQDIYDIIRLS